MDPLSAAAAPTGLDFLLMSVGSSKIFNAMVMILMNIGGKYLAMELPSNIDKLFQNYQFMRYLVIFAICFMATRDIKIAFMMGLIVIMVFKYILNESSMYCVIKKEHFENLEKKKKEEKKEEFQEKKPLTEADFQNAREVIEKYLSNNPSGNSPRMG